MRGTPKIQKNLGKIEGSLSKAGIAGMRLSGAKKYREGRGKNDGKGGFQRRRPAGAAERTIMKGRKVVRLCRGRASGVGRNPKPVSRNCLARTGEERGKKGARAAANEDRIEALDWR